MKRIELIGGMVIAILLAVGLSIVGNWYLTAQKSEGRAAVLTNASAGIISGVQSSQQQDDIDNGLSAGKQQFHDTKEKVKAHEPSLRIRADSAVPVQLRDAFSARRRARERLGCAGSECPSRR